jgi:A/G-specific adenine glycosylase
LYVLFYISLFTFKSKSVSQAASDIEQVNALWKGLGYYSRASRLLAGAQKVVKTLAGRLPDNAKEMQDKVPGIGRYSAGAICSIAYGERVPVVSDALLFLATHRH